MRKVFSFILNLAVYIAIVVGVVWGVPAFLSWKLGTEYPIAAITSGSMWPGLKRGDLVLIKAVPKEALAVGDVVVWQHEGGFTIHRIVRLEEKTLVTKGDANFTEDPPVQYSEVVGRALEWGEKLVRVPYLGLVSLWGRQMQANKD